MRLKALTLTLGLLFSIGSLEAVTISQSFTAVGNGQSISVQRNDSFSYSVSGTFVGTVVLERSTNFQSWVPIVTITGASSDTLNSSSTGSSTIAYRFRCAAFTSGTIVTSLSDATTSSVIQEFKNKNGSPIVAITGDGLAVTGNLSVSGTESMTGLASFSAGVSVPRLNVASTATIAALSSAAGFVKLTGSTATDLQGIAAGLNGQRLIVCNLTAQTLTIRNASSSAASGNKITTMTGADVLTTGNGCGEFVYDTDASPAVWLLMTQNL